SQEMLVHPAFFTHPCIKKVALMCTDNAGVLEETLKHACLTDVWLRADSSTPIQDSRVHYYKETWSEWLANCSPNSLDLLITDHSLVETSIYQTYYSALQKNGLLIQLTHSLFQFDEIKRCYQIIQAA